jgi:hypothetical protein
MIDELGVHTYGIELEFQKLVVVNEIGLYEVMLLLLNIVHEILLGLLIVIKLIV